jgi:hypothetical protein
VRPRTTPRWVETRRSGRQIKIDFGIKIVSWGSRLEVLTAGGAVTPVVPTSFLQALGRSPGAGQCVQRAEGTPGASDARENAGKGRHRAAQ